MRVVYQLIVTGPSLTTGFPHTIRSKSLFGTTKQAMDYLPEFTTKVCGDGLFDLESVSDVKVFELELVEDGNDLEEPKEV